MELVGEPLGPPPRSSTVVVVASSSSLSLSLSFSLFPPPTPPSPVVTARPPRAPPAPLRSALPEPHSGPLTSLRGDVTAPAAALLLVERGGVRQAPPCRGG